MPIINSVVAGGGTTPTGTIQITNNGVTDVTNYANADVQVPTTAPALYREFQLNSNGKLLPNTTTTHILDFTGITDISDYALAYAYQGNRNITGALDLSDLNIINGAFALYYSFAETNITSVDLSGLTQIQGSSALALVFYNCTQLTSVDLSNLTVIGGSNGLSNAFAQCRSLTSIDFPKLTSIFNAGLAIAFSGDSALTNIEFPLLETVDSQGLSNAFAGATSLTKMDFPSLNSIIGNIAMQSCFYGCTALSSISFYALDTNSFGTRVNQFNNMLTGVTGCTVHFPMRIQSTIGSWTSVTGGFGGTNTTVLFDIVCTLTGADSNTYTRSQKDSISTATAWDNGGTLYYTSGTSEPAVGDTIYSDSACTTAVTTISSIA